MNLKNWLLRFELDKTSSLFVNPASGAIDIVPANFFEGSMPVRGKDTLKERGYFLTDEERARELLYLESVYNEHCKNIPYWFYILTTLNCNFGCPICYEKKTLANLEISPEMTEVAVDFVAKFQEERGLSSDRINLVLFGGEPLCVSKPRIIHKILSLAAEKKWKVIIVTNGSRVGRFMGTMKEYSGTISDLRVTLDGPKDIHNSRRPYKGGGGSFGDVVRAIELLLDNGFEVKMQTIVGAGNISFLDEIVAFIKRRGWLRRPNFQWRIEGSHDYANLDREKDEISEGAMVGKLIQLWESCEELRGKMKFESFKYLGHIVRSFGWLGDYKTYWGPKFGFCEPQKGFQYVFGTDGGIFHCPRVINNPDFCVGSVEEGFFPRERELKHRTILEKSSCASCHLNTLCGGGCIVRQRYYPELDCQNYCWSVISEFVDLMRKKILERAIPDRIVSINDLWHK